MQRDYDKVKLHITLINTIFRQEPDAESGRETKKSSDTHRGGGGKIRESFDARRILQVCGVAYNPLRMYTVDSNSTFIRS